MVTNSRIPSTLALVACLSFVLTPRRAYAEEETCDARDSELARGAFRQAEALRASGESRDAADRYAVAYNLCPRPFLLFNAAQMMWDAGDREAALLIYEQYIERQTASADESVPPDEQTVAALITARHRFFEAAEDLRLEGRLEDALLNYKRYLAHAPDGDQAAQASAHAAQLSEELAAAEERDESSEEEDARPDAEKFARAPETRDDEADPRPHWRTNWRPLALLGVGSVMLIGGTAYRHEPEGVATMLLGGLVFGTGTVWLLADRLEWKLGRASRRGAHVRLVPMAGPDVLGGSLALSF